MHTGSLRDHSIWLEHPDYPGYRFSPEGGALSLKRNQPKLLKFRISRGYPRTNLFNKSAGKIKSVFIHRITAEIFCPNPFGKNTVNHIDGNKQNGHASNLEWCTLHENRQHAYRTGLQNAHHRRGVKSNFAVLTDELVLSILNDLQNCKWGDQVKVASKYKVTPGLISMIKTGKVWAHLKKPTGG